MQVIRPFSPWIVPFVLAAGLQLQPALAADVETNTPGELRVAYRTDDKPVSFLQDGKPTGFLIELVNEIARRAGLKVTYVSTTFAAMLPGVQNHQLDTAAFGVLVTPKRAGVVNFTTATGYGQARLVSRKNAPLAAIERAGGKTVAVTTGSALIPLLQTIAPTVTIKEFPNIASSANALIAGQVDGLFTGIATASHLVEQHPELATTQTVESGMNALPVAKDRPRLLAAMNQAIAAMMKDGTYSRLFTKWNEPTIGIPERMFHDYPGMPRPAAAAAR
ncbi:MAG TPA: transporter substrate-binding domain-containing protein [Usitatibacter sp.]|nr:transporter substrate-binding domain-containing protein [Usitatibacter sp.]